MVDTDPFVQWIDVPDDLPVLPPVDEDVVSGLKDIASLGPQADLDIDEHRYEPNSGLLLGTCHTVPQDVTFSVPAHPPTASIDSFPSPISYSSFYPPALSPDSSPSSIASSTPWLRTPAVDTSLHVANFTPAPDMLLPLTETEETCSSTMQLVDQSGNSLEDIQSMVPEMMPEDIACTPQVVFNTSLPLPNAPSLMISPSHSQFETEAVLGSIHRSSPTPFSPYLQSLFAFSQEVCNAQENPSCGYSASPSLSPLSTLSIFSQSPSMSTNPLPFIKYSSLSPEISLVPLSEADEEFGTSTSVATSGRLQRKRGVGTLGDASKTHTSKRSKAKRDDDDEWNPDSERVKRPRVVAFSHPARQTSSIPSSPLGGSSSCGTSQDSEGQSDTHTCCEFCGQNFTRASDYIRHMENSASHPETRKVWPCPYCDSELGRRDALGRHIRTIHPGRTVSISTSGSRLSRGLKESSLERMGQRQVPPMRQLRKDTRRHR